MKAWLKGGIIGAILGLIFSLFYISKSGQNINILIKIIDFILTPVGFVSKLFPCSGEGCMGVALIIIPLLSILYCFLIGALIGFIIGKFKK
jgi:hypothetical protein